MAFQQLLTERLRTRRLAQSDAAALAAYRSRPEVSRYQSWSEFSEADAAQLIATMASAEPGTPGAWFQFGVALRESDLLIGDIGLQTRDSTTGRSFIGFTIAPEYGGRGYMTEAVGAVLSFARDTLGLEAVWGSCDPRNTRSIAMLHRLRFVRVEEHVRAYESKGEWVDDWIYELKL